MKSGIPLLPFLLLGASAASHAFTLDIAGSELMEFGQGPHSIFVPGYGEVAFESGLDGALVVDSAYASTDRIEVPPPAGDSAVEPAIQETVVDSNPEFVKISTRSTPAPPLPQSILQPVGDTPQNQPDRWNAVPEAASATLGLIGTLLLLLRRRVKTMS